MHPATGRTMVYMAAQPTHGTDVFVGDEEELAEVRWVSLAEAEELMNGMIFEPVQKTSSKCGCRKSCHPHLTWDSCTQTDLGRTAAGPTRLRDDQVL